METHSVPKLQARTKIIATVGPINSSHEQLRDLALAGVDVFRLNFAHGKYDWLEEVVSTIRAISQELNQPIGILGDLAGPKIRLGELPPEGVECVQGQLFSFVRESVPYDGFRLSSTYEYLTEDLEPGNAVLLADGTVGMEVLKRQEDGSILCQVNRPGIIRSRQGINLPGANLRTPSLTTKDREDLAWGLSQKINFFGLSFVRKAEDILELRGLIDQQNPGYVPLIVAKIEKVEAVQELEAITKVCDCVMVARGDLGVETEIAALPILQKKIIRHCNERRIPVITATQMLDSMQVHPFPTRAEANDVANAVLDGTDAVMLSGETAIGKYPLRAVEMMERIVRLTEEEIHRRDDIDWKTESKNRALVITEAVTLGACTVAEHLKAEMMAMCTQSGRTALAVSRQRSRIPVLALTDDLHTAQKMCLYWGVIPIHTPVVADDPACILEFAVEWGRQRNLIRSGSRLVLISDTNWGTKGHDLMVVHVVP